MAELCGLFVVSILLMGRFLGACLKLCFCFVCQWGVGLLGRFFCGCGFVCVVRGSVWLWLGLGVCFMGVFITGFVEYWNYFPTTYIE